MPQEHNALPAALGSGKDNSVGITRGWGLPGRTQVRCYFLILASGKKSQALQSNTTSNWTRSKLPGSRPWCPSSARSQPAGLARGLVRMAGGDSLPAPGSVPWRHSALWLPWFRLRALSPDTEALPCSGRSSRGQPGSYRVRNARRAGKHWTLPTWGHPPDWAPPRPCGARGPIIGPLYPVRLLFIPGPEVWGFKPHKAWTRCPGP